MERSLEYLYTQIVLYVILLITFAVWDKLNEISKQEFIVCTVEKATKLSEPNRQQGKLYQMKLLMVINTREMVHKNNFLTRSPHKRLEASVTQLSNSWTDKFHRF